MISKKSTTRKTAKTAKTKTSPSRKKTSKRSLKSASARSARKTAKTAKAKASPSRKKISKRSVKSASARSVGAKSPLVKKTPIPVKVKQSCSYKGQNWWEWAVWVEGPDKVLDEIEYVEYALHSTFPEPVRRKTNRGENFRIESAGWGEFMIKIEISTRKGEHFKTQHWLSLDYPAASSSLMSSGAMSSKPRHERPTLFLSAGVSELRFGNELAQELEKLGCEVLKMEDAPSDIPWERAILLLVKRCDLLVMLISGKLTSWGMKQIDAALNLNLPILPVVIGSSSRLPEQLRDFQAINLKDAYDPAIAPDVAQQIKQSIKHRPA